MRSNSKLLLCTVVLLAACEGTVQNCPQGSCLDAGNTGGGASATGGGTSSTGGGAGAGGGTQLDGGEDSGVDAGNDAGVDAGVDAGTDAGTDAGVDAGVTDAGVDAGVTDAGLGAACSSAADCASHFCVDGVCCDSACGGLCEACNRSGREGTCDAFDGGLDPDNECASTLATSCGTTGFCSGDRSCALYPALTTECAQATCSGNTSNLADTCDGLGTCIDRGTQACSPYACSSSSGLCKTMCVTSGDCASGYECGPSGACQLAAGVMCSANAECASGFCADGVCCQSACSGLCEACNLPGRAGFCDPMPAATDPANECTAQTAATCGTNGFCNGARACQLYASGTTCLAATCGATGVSNPADTCNGSGTCVDSGTVACSPYTCHAATGTCNVSCAAPSDCLSGYTCAATVCKLVQGSVCSSASDCASGFCTDGVCCGSACNGTCESCSQPGRAGFCDPVAVGQDPANECAASPASSCGTNGVCDGARACQLYALGSTCVAASCTGATSNLADTCNGTGTCVDHGTVSCAPYTCNSASGLCNATCTVPGDCLSGYTCATGVCKLVQGSVCTVGSQCAGGFCTDGVCCGSACNGSCESCNQPGRLGFCDPVPVGQDPANECPTTAASTCGTDGVCNGARACELYASGTTCVAASCGAVGTSSPADTCNGSGTCVDTGTVSCAPYTCNSASGLCNATCTVPGDCLSGYTCATGVCKLVQGSVCTVGSQCAGGFCTDGVCCGSACNGTCESCNQPGRLGFCDPVPVGQDPANECPSTAASTCGTTGVCSGARSCSLYSAGTTCAAASCTIAGDASNVPDTCNGSGTCVDNGTVSCGTYSCNVGSGTCRTTCSVAGDCSSGHTCSPPVCN